ncbi:ribosome maturation factor RimM [Campylobacter peloridis]|uniref:Ribosome maturation factor RimM n=1 Tax=Campylobacter peloridis TaxID=488546 RepID=A0ABX6TUC1_9BACT|nr:ribosome maturation factor RimM [Campylobacter peloridis]AJC84913.1 16S rRNA processing protein [Campylobacter peloridis LMG 23910]MBX1886406.1 16S rRNA processing protein RimM [Campylobacter peloridis]MBX2078560.1 16S rRNA processing protein RimM [Campylobacter peloridis]QOQ88948.1 16S rRNA processing protein RimM [Campylobacter peloridis]
MNNNLVQVAKLGKCVGLKGYVKLHNLSDFNEQYKKGARFFDKNQKIYTIKTFDKSRSIVLFEGFESIELARNLTNITLYQSIELTRQTCKLKKDEYFYFDIIGCDVYENEQKLGVVEDILESGAGFLFCIRCDESLQVKVKNFYIPYVDKYIQKIDIENKKILSQFALDILENS